MDTPILRIIDANRNRLAEGLRVLEDISRFMLNDAILNDQLKSIRHSLVTVFNKIGIEMINQRNSTEDIGSKMDPVIHQDKLVDIVTANSKRVQEALRVLEELTKIAGLEIDIDSNKFKEARFSIYEIERILVAKMLRTKKVSMIKGLYVILDTYFIDLNNIEAIAHKIIKAGVKIIQFRDKKTDKRNLYLVSNKIRNICLNNSVLFIVNDYVDIAGLVNADGVQLGQNDLPITAARKLLPITTMIGYSVYSVIQAQKAVEEGADYIGIGSIFPTKTRGDTPIVGIELIKQVRQFTNIPIVAIGGINKSNIAQVFLSGANSAAVISALYSESNIEVAVRELIKELDKCY